MANGHKMLSDGSKELDLGRADHRDIAQLCPASVDMADFAAMGEAGRVAAIRAASVVPPICGPDIPAAPARGPLATFTPMRLVPGHVGVAEHTGHWQRGEDRRRKGARIEDVFDRIEDEARKAHKARGDTAGRYLSPLTPAQVQIGRDYRDLTERHAAGGMRCASLEAAGRRQGGTGGEFIDAYVAEGARLDALVRRIGLATAMAIRRVRPSARGARTAIRDRDLVDMICLQDMDPSAVLRRFGWVKSTANLAALRKALAEALDRMIGYDVGRATHNRHGVRPITATGCDP